LQNNLNLFVQHEPSGKKWIGNANLPLSLGVPDPDNNVEVIRLENPESGAYLIQISAINLLRPPQDYALVVTGELGSKLTPM
jgi:serine protease AprX